MDAMQRILTVKTVGQGQNSHDHLADRTGTQFLIYPLPDFSVPVIRQQIIAYPGITERLGLALQTTDHMPVVYAAPLVIMIRHIYPL